VGIAFTPLLRRAERTVKIDKKERFRAKSPESLINSGFAGIFEKFVMVVRQLYYGCQATILWLSDGYINVAKATILWLTLQH
jgi:hypothetical protein